MTKTLGDMMTRIKDDYVNESITDAQIVDAINRAVAYYSDEPLWFNQTQATFATVAAQEYYGSDDFTGVVNMTKVYSIIIGNPYRFLRGINPSVIAEMQDGTVAGLPQVYSVFNNQIRLWPIPSSVETATIQYSTVYDDLAEQDDTNPWLTYGWEVIKQAAKYRLAMDILQADDVAARCKVMEQDAFSAMQAENRRRQPQDRLYVEQMPVKPSRFNIYRGF